MDSIKADIRALHEYLTKCCVIFLGKRNFENFAYCLRKGTFIDEHSDGRFSQKDKKALEEIMKKKNYIEKEENVSETHIYFNQHISSIILVEGLK